MSSTEHGTVFEASAAASSAVRSLPRIAGASGPRMLSPTALKVAAQRFKPAYSPIVLAGTVRLLEAALIIAIGLAVYFWHVVPAVGFAWYYVGTIVGMYESDDGSGFGLIVRPRGSESFEVPGAGGFSEAYSINLLGVIVGDYADADGMFHGFFRIPAHDRDGR